MGTLFGAPQISHKLEVTVQDQNHLAMNGVRLTIRTESSPVVNTHSDSNGHAEFVDLNGVIDD